MARTLHTAGIIAKQGARRLAGRLGPHRWHARAPRLWVLMYHRVLPAEQARAEGEEPGMYVTPETFSRHLAWLRECFEVVRLGDWVQRVNRGAMVPARSCAITFDDGWRDNFEHALPLLRETQTPATVFAVSHLIGTNGEFWPNRLSRLLDIYREKVLSHGSFDWLRHLAAERGVPLATALTDTDARAALIEACKGSSDAELNRQLDATEEHCPLPEAPPSLMDWEQLRAMRDSGLVDIGSHTCHHYRLRPELAPETAAAEIRASKMRLEQELERPVFLFCYPNGNYTGAAAHLVAREYAAAVTTQRGINTADTPLNKLARIGMHEDISATYDGFMARLSGWI